MAVQKRSAELDWEDVRCFAALARHGTLAATARILKVTHATVARRLANLESTLGRPLFARNRAGYRLNAAGAAALGEAAQMELAAGALHAARDTSVNVSGLVRVTVAQVFADGFLAERLGSLTKRHPGLELEIVATSRTPSLARRAAEIALRLARPAAGELVARRIATLDYGFYTSPEYRQRIDCGETPVFIAFDDASDHVPEAHWTQRFLTGRHVALRANSQGAQAAAARGGSGVALLPGLLARALGGLERVEFDATPPERTLWLLMRPDVARLARARVVAEHLAELFGERHIRERIRMSGDEGAGLTRRNLYIMCAAGAILMITMGMRQSLGLFIKPIIATTHVGYASMGFAMAVGQLMWGIAQPAFGALADRHGANRVLIAGALLLAIGTALTPFATNEFGFIVTLGVFTAVGAGAGSFGVLMGVVAQRVPAERRSFASGFVNAGGSLGQFIFAPVNQALIVSIGWMGAMWAMAVAAIGTIPLARPLLRGTPAPASGMRVAGAVAPMTMREQLRIASRDKSYWCLHAGFFTCGFHISFLVTHLPGEVNLCALPASVAASSIAIIGLANVAGSLMAGWAGGVMRMKWLLFAMYLSRAVAVLIYLAAPKTPLTFYVFAAVLGFTWLATVPPTAGLIGKLFGVRYLATLFGLATLTHQVGGFLGASLGGIAMVRFGDFSWMWYADAALATAAAFINLPIKEAPLRTAPAPA